MSLKDESDRSGVTRGALIGVLATLFLVSAGWFALLYVRGVARDSLDMEFAKALLQVGVVSVAATILSLVVFGYQHRVEIDQRARERRNETQQREIDKRNNRLQFRDDHLKATLARITTSYNNTKRARRKMRALGMRHTQEGVVLRLDRYDECMADLNDAQLDLEMIKSDVKTSRPAYASRDQLSPSLRSMEQYLGSLIEEYELMRAKSAPDQRETSLSTVPRLADFLDRSDTAQFATEFSNAHTVAREAIRSDLLHLSFRDEQLGSSPA